jgi:TetR/AcrR family transcriptional repressor of bet genes
MPRPENTDERREQIARAFQKVMAKKGYDGAAIADVAKAAGLTPGLLHYHFKSKLEILLAVLEGLASRHRHALEAHLSAAGGDAAKELAAFIDFHLALGSAADPEVLACWITLSGEALRTPRVKKDFEKAVTSILERLAATIRSGVKAGVFDCQDPKAAASALFAAIQGYFVLSATARSAIPRGSAAASVKRMAHGLLRSALPLDRNEPRP